MALTLQKYEALGNDFLVLVDGGHRSPFDAALARVLCERRRGIGADGLMRVGVKGPGALTMELRNADGGVAETSGNGLRCALLAAADAGLVRGAGPVEISTLAGTVRAEILERDDASAQVRVAMGSCAVDEEPESPAGGWRALSVDVGNPHLVLLAGHGAIGLALEDIGPRLERERPGGVNVELVHVVDPTRLVLEVWERGVGRTRACGSGSCAAAAAARRCGLVGDEVVVDNPGGRLRVRLAGTRERPTAELEGPVRRVAAVSVGEALLAEAAQARAAAP